LLICLQYQIIFYICVTKPKAIMNHIGLFEGIGGFSLAARWMGWETIAWCEWNEFGQKVLKHHFPKAASHGDITKTDFTIYRGQCDIVTGGFPCQPYSSAGKRLGKEDDRHLWPEMCRAIREIQPSWVVGENVRGLTNWNGGMVFDEVQADLEAEGYEVLPFLLPACAVNAPHRRDRIWFVAYSKSFDNRRKRGNMEEQDGKAGIRKQKNAVYEFAHNGSEGDAPNPNSAPTEHKVSTGGNLPTSSLQQDAPNPDSNGQPSKEHGQTESRRIAETSIPSDWSNFPTQSPICTGDDGLSTRLDNITFPKWRNESIKAAGNAIVPQVAYQIFQTINLYNDQK
jgi:DNA (cytosine-5)-methyltransferase 1